MRPVPSASIGVSLALTTGCLAYERKLAHALEHEDELVAAAGGEDYEDVRRDLERRTLGDAEVRSTLMAAAERYQLAALAWQDLAGNIPAPWVAGPGRAHPAHGGAAGSGRPAGPDRARSAAAPGRPGRPR